MRQVNRDDNCDSKTNSSSIDGLQVTSQVLLVLYLSESPQHLQSCLPGFTDEETKAGTGLRD